MSDRSRLAALLLLGLAACGEQASGGDAALVVVAGQSNAVGYNLTAADLPVEARPGDPRTLIWDGQAFAPMRPGLNTGAPNQPAAWGPEVEFARRWRADHPDGTLRIVKFARGSTGVAADPDQRDWSPATGELFAEAGEEVAQARAALGGARVNAVLWVQGEADAVDGAKAEAYRDNLAGLFAAMRARGGDAATPILFSQVSARPALPYGPAVRDAQAGVDAADARAAMTKTDAFGVQADRLHYSAAGQIALGGALYDLYADRRRP